MNYFEVMFKYINYYVLRIRTNKQTNLPEDLRNEFEDSEKIDRLVLHFRVAAHKRQGQDLNVTSPVQNLFIICCCWCVIVVIVVVAYVVTVVAVVVLCCYICCYRCCCARRYCCCCCWSIVVHRIWLLTFFLSSGCRGEGGGSEF